jgi:hypothetical protein
LGFLTKKQENKDERGGYMQLTFENFMIGYVCLLVLVDVLLVAANWRIEQRNKREQRQQQGERQ